MGRPIAVRAGCGPPENPQAVSGMDFVILHGEKASSLYAFVDDPGSEGQSPN